MRLRRRSCEPWSRSLLLGAPWPRRPGGDHRRCATPLAGDRDRPPLTMAPKTPALPPRAARNRPIPNPATHPVAGGRTPPAGCRADRNQVGQKTISCECSTMQVASLQKEIEQLPEDQQDQLAAFLTALRMHRTGLDREILGRLDDPDPARWKPWQEVKAGLAGHDSSEE